MQTVLDPFFEPVEEYVEETPYQQLMNDNSIVPKRGAET